MRDLINSNLLPGTMISTDEFASYNELSKRGYGHISVNHRFDEYVNAKTGATVNAMEGYWAALKRGINGTHIHVSGKHLPKYLAEFEYRYNMRYLPRLMFDRLLWSFSK